MLLYQWVQCIVIGHLDTNLRKPTPDCCTYNNVRFIQVIDSGLQLIPCFDFGRGICVLFYIFNVIRKKQPPTLHLPLHGTLIKVDHRQRQYSGHGSNSKDIQHGLELVLGRVGRWLQYDVWCGRSIFNGQCDSRRFVFSKTSLTCGKLYYLAT